MKQHIFTTFFVSVALLTAAITATAQRLPCGNNKIDTNALNAASKFRVSRAGRPLAVNYLVRVYFHIVRDDNKTNAALTEQQLKTEFASLLTKYTADNVCFLNAGFDYVNNTFLNNLFNADNDPEGTFFNPYQIPGCINVFYMQVIKGNNTACSPPCGYGGIALGGIPGTFLLLGISNIGDNVSLAHEVGHCIGLLHTFNQGTGFENIDGSNSTTSADRVADTPADPFAYNGNITCYAKSADGCTYTGSCKDPNGKTNFTPPYNNVMSYWPPGCYPGQILTNGQFTVVNSILNTYAPIKNCLSLSAVTQIPITFSSGFYINSAINTFNTSGDVIFNGSVKAVIGGGTVFLNPGFHAYPSTGQVTISSKPCN